MIKAGLNIHVVGILLSVCVATLAVQPAEAQWSQWGGPNRDFTVKTTGLAGSWPENGPRQLWKRELGDGYSSVIVDDGLVFVMYRKVRNEPRESTAALDAKTGEIVWEHEVASALTDGETRFGDGPNSTPLVSGDRLYSVGANALVQCFNKKTGEVLWKYDLVAEQRALIGGWGYSCSPIAYKDKLIIAIDHEFPDGQHSRESDEPTAEEVAQAPTLAALNARDGKLLWTSQSRRMDHASPIVINYGGQDQLVLLTRNALIGVDLNDGSLLWSSEQDGSGARNTTPLYDGEDTLFLFGGAPGRAIQLYQEGGETRTRELWSNKKLSFSQPTPAIVGDILVGSTGGNGPGLLLGVDLETGKRLWAKRGFQLATCVAGDGKLVLLDEQGTLALITATRAGIEVHSSCKILEPEAYATPALVGTKLYARDRRHVVAFDLGIEANSK